jgi:hypothetical protein
MVARLLEERRSFPLVDVIEALQPLAQPELLETTSKDKPAEATREDEPRVDTLIAPVSRLISP